MANPLSIHSVPVFFIWTSLLLPLSTEVICSDDNIYFPSDPDSNTNNSTFTISKFEEYLLNFRTNKNNIVHPNQNQNGSEFQNNLPQSRNDRIFRVDSSIFQNYLKYIDLSSVYTGYQEDGDFENWIPPEEIQRDLPTYMSGFDYENRPIWVVEYAKYNYTKYATLGRRVQGLFKKYFRYVAYTALKSHALRSTPEHPVTRHNIIVDFEGLTLEQILDSKAFQLQLSWIRDNRRFSDKFIHKIVALNVNEISETVFTFSRSFILSLWNRIEVYGTNKANYIPHLLKIFPKDQIPEWYGGSNGFMPLYVVG